MRLSQAYIPTQKEVPADAVMPSHRLMLRSGMIRLLASGVYSYLPLGWRIMKKVMQIIREEMDRIGAQELHLPVLNPVEIWDETGRNTDFGDELFRLKDRKNRILVLAPTHEEIICDLARKFIRSYKDMPQSWYQIQTKFRDEPRPRSGVIRTRQFTMKDSYSLDVDETGLDRSYALHAQAYRAIFTRCGLRFHVVGASSGLMGGSASQEFMVESDFGEDTLALCPSCGYADNMEIAKSLPEVPAAEVEPRQKVSTPDKRTIRDVSAFLNVSPSRLIKSLVYKFKDGFIMVLVRGDHDVNESKLQKCLGAGQLRPALPEEVLAVCGAETGFVGPVGLGPAVRILADEAIQNQHTMITGANENGFHLKGLEWKRDIEPEAFADLRNILPGEKCTQCNGPLKLANAIELGHIFKLGTKYTSAMKASYLDEKGESHPIVMGSYGIGVERIIAAAIEQNRDDKGMVFDPVLAPYVIHVIPLKMDQPEVLTTAERLYHTCQAAGLDALLDDRRVSPGFKFKDADLLGMPVQAILGETWLKEKRIEMKWRKDGRCVTVDEKDFLPQVQAWIRGA